MGEFSYSGIMILTLMSLATFIPYKLWKWSHRFFWLFFAFAALHYVYIEKPYALMDFPGMYTFFFCLMGVWSYLYLLVPRMVGHNNVTYKVSEVVNHGDVTEINLTPQKRGIRHKAGQFAFVNFESLTLREVHPVHHQQCPQ